MPNNKNTRSPNGGGSIRKIEKYGHTYWEGTLSLGFDSVTGRRIRKYVSGATQKEVRQKISEISAEVDKGIFTEASDMTLEKWLGIWLSNIEGSVKTLTLQTYDSRLRSYVIPALGKVKLCDLKPYMIQDFEKQLTRDKNLAPKTVINILAILQKALNQAVREELIFKNPANAVDKPKLKTLRDISPLTKTELHNFLDLLHENDDVYSRLCEVTVYSGMREGEICGLSWNDVDFAKNRIVVRQQLQKTKTKGSHYFIDTTKNDRKRVIYVPRYVMDIFRRQRDYQRQWREALGSEYFNEWNLVFTKENGHHLAPQQVLKVYKRYVTEIGRPDARFHDLRHTYAVNALERGVNVKTVQEALGHATAAFTLDVYGHVTDEMQRELVNRMDDLIDEMNA